MLKNVDKIPTYKNCGKATSIELRHRMFSSSVMDATVTNSGLYFPALCVTRGRCYWHQDDQN